MRLELEQKARFKSLILRNQLKNEKKKIEIASRADVLEAYKTLKDSIEIAPELTKLLDNALISPIKIIPEEFLSSSNRFQSKKVEDVRLTLNENTPIQ